MLSPARSLSPVAPLLGRRRARKLRGGVVVVTGASSGIGLATAERLARDGYEVLAGVRNHDDARRLERLHPQIRPVMLDVTDPEHIKAIASLVEELAPDGLAALINNAGIGLLAPVETTSVEDWRRVLDVNLIGTADITRALLPSLIRRGGRVVNIGSAAGRVGFPLFAVYSTSKFALEGFTDVLRREVAQHGVSVTLMQPGVIATPIYDRTLPDSYARAAELDPSQAARYGTQLQSALSSAETSGTEAAPPSGVADAVAEVLARRRPPTRRVVGRDARIAVFCSRFLSDRACDFIVSRVTRS